MKPTGNNELTVKATAADGPTFRILCVHGVGNHHVDLSWQGAWAQAIAASILRWQNDASVVLRFMMYDDLFANQKIGLVNTAEAVGKLLASGIYHGIGDLFTRRRGLFDIPDHVRWTAGMVAQWVENEPLRAALRKELVTQIKDFDPQVIAAHSLGTLVSYDTFIQPDSRASVKGRTFVSFGSQIGNPFVRGTFGGRLVGLQDAKWYHLFNRHDSVLTAQIDLRDGGFEQIDTPFDLPGMADHDATAYLAHPAAVQRAWAPIAGAPPARAAAVGSRAFVQLKKEVHGTRRALLVGINDYPDPQMCLEGCTNDTFLVSSMLQEIGFTPDEIRVVLNDRATAEGIRDRLQWLLDGAQEGDTRVFYYSGHGAQIAGYGYGEVVDRSDECLVPYDFDWTYERAVVDDWLFELYSQMPYGVSLAMVLDCCHSGGLTRECRGKPRGIDPPDDVRHRSMKWNRGEKMWEERKIPPPNRALTDVKPKRTPKTSRLAQESYLGAEGNKRRIGRGTIALQTLTNKGYDSTTKALGHRGPFQPLIYHACQEDQYSWEYRHGGHSYGAFTYALALTIREWPGKAAPTFRTLLEATGAKLERLGYDQTPGIFGPKQVQDAPVPWFGRATR